MQMQSIIMSLSPEIIMKKCDFIGLVWSVVALTMYIIRLICLFYGNQAIAFVVKSKTQKTNDASEVTGFVWILFYPVYYNWMIFVDVLERPGNIDVYTTMHKQGKPYINQAITRFVVVFSSYFFLVFLFLLCSYQWQIANSSNVFQNTYAICTHTWMVDGLCIEMSKCYS